MAEQKPDFFLESDSTEKDITAVTTVLLNPLFVVGYPILSVFCGVLAIAALVLRMYFYFILLLVFCGFTIYARFRMVAKMTARQMKIYRERYGADVVHQQLIFWPQGLVVVNTTAQSQYNLTYDTFTSITAKKGYLILRTAAKQAVVIKPSTLEQAPELVPYLLEKCPNAKRKGF